MIKINTHLKNGVPNEYCNQLRDVSIEIIDFDIVVKTNLQSSELIVKSVKKAIDEKESELKENIKKLTAALSGARHQLNVIEMHNQFM